MVFKINDEWVDSAEMSKSGINSQLANNVKNALEQSDVETIGSVKAKAKAKEAKPKVIGISEVIESIIESKNDRTIETEDSKLAIDNDKE